MKKRYTKRQITEAIAYWKKQLKMMNESCSAVNESSISDFFGKVFKTKKFLAAQDELVKQKNYKEHPLMKVADKMANDPSNRRYIVRFTNVDVENAGYPTDINYKLDCVVLALNRDGADRYDNIADDKDDWPQQYSIWMDNSREMT